MIFQPRRVLTALMIACAAATMAAQRPDPRIDDPVTVDFFAVEGSRPVFDLRPDDVTLKVDGRPRRIRSLRYIDLQTAAPGAPLPSSTELEDPFATNVQDASGRWVTVVVDHESVRAGTERHALNAVIRMVQGLGARDRVSYVTMPNGGVEIDFTEKHEQVVDALRKFVGRAPRESSEQERSCRTRLLLNTMRDYIEGLTPLEGPKSVVLVSSGMLNPRRDAPLNAPPGPCEIRMIYFQEVGLAASRARASTYVVQPDDVNMDPARQVFVTPTASRFSAADEDRAGLESFAGVTGGDFMRIIEPDDNTLLNFMRARSGYYIATFDPDAGERNGAPHRVQIDVARDKVRVHTRPEVYIPRRSTIRSSQVSAKEMLRNGVFYRALPLRATAYASASGGGKVKILSVLEPVEPGTRITDAVFGLIAGDRLVAQWTADAAELSSMPIITAGEAAPGVYTLRVAAIDATGRRGAVEYDIVARLSEAAPLTTSALALGVARDGFTPKLVFGTDQAVVSYLEIYGAAPRADSVSVRLEIADSPEGRALTTGAARVVAQGDSRRIAVGALPISSLAPGEYVVRAIVSLEGRPVGRVLRTLRKSPTGS